MIIYNLNTDISNSHRVGWNSLITKITNSINDNIDFKTNANINQKIILIDYVDKYFNSWLDMKKHILFDSILYIYSNKDTFFHINDKDKEDVFILKNNINIFECIKWYPEYNEFKKLRGVLKTDIVKKYNIKNINSEWIGIVHYPEFIKEMNYESHEDFKNIIKNNRFTQALRYCKCLITMSDWLNKYVTDILKKNNITNINVKTIYHPTDSDCKKFTFTSFDMNLDKHIIQIGYWMRKHTTIYHINTTFKKLWLPGGIYWKTMFNKIYNKEKYKYLEDKTVEIMLNLSNDVYDELLSKNIVCIDVFNSSANNTVLECIIRNTPILINKHPAIIEYLGEDYPLYFNDIDDLNIIINSLSYSDKIHAAYLYLCNMNKYKFTIEYFVSELLKICND